MKKILAVFFGGRSVEHDISIVTGLQLMENMNTDRYDCLPVYIAQDGKWYTGEALKNLDFMRTFRPDDKGVQSVFLPPIPGEAALTGHSKGLLGTKVETFPFDVAILCMHGLNGEDGSLQGVLELANIPYSSSGLLGSAAGMDKILMKAAFAGAGIPVVDSHGFLRDEWETNPDDVVTAIEDKMEYPLIIKPANLGSSIGIGRAEDRDGLYGCVEVALRYDSRIIVEHAIVDMMEINCSVLGYGNELTPSVCEQPVSWQEFLSFEEKYLQQNADGKLSATTPSGDMQSMSRIVPAPIPDEVRDHIQELSCRIFRLMDCKGVVRIDFMIDKAHDFQVYANEINTIPGSMAYYLWQENGMSYARLIDKLVELALDAHREKNRNTYAFDSDVLKKVNYSGNKFAKGGRRNKI